MRCALVAGARPQFIKAAALLPALRACGETLFWHTGQHGDPAMSADLFADLKVPKPDLHLDVGPENRTDAMARELARAAGAVDRIVVMGDTDSTVAGARAARGKRLAHVEAGCRSGEPDLPEERNRIEVDSLSGLLLFAAAPPTAWSAEEEAGAETETHAGDHAPRTSRAATACTWSAT